MKHRNTILLIIIVVVICGLGFYLYSSNSSKNTAIVKKTTTQKVTKGDLRIGYTSDGKINLSLTNLDFEVSGVLKTIKVKNGDSVKKGQILAILEDSDLRQEVTKAKNSYDKAVANLADAKTQRKINIISEKLKLDQAKEKVTNTPDNATAVAEYSIEKLRYDSLVNNNNQVLNAQLSLTDTKNNLSAANEKLSKAVLRAPFAGKVISIANKVGEVVSAGNSNGNSSASLNSSSSSNAFLVLCDPSEIYLKTSVSESDITGIEPGQVININVDALNLENLTGKTTEVSNIPKTDSSGIVTYQVVGKLDKVDSNIRDGMNCTITFVKVEKLGILMIPNKAVYIESDKQYVNVKDSTGSVVKTEVQTGLSDGSQVEVVSGLNEGETLVIGGTN